MVFRSTMPDPSIISGAGCAPLLAPFLLQRLKQFPTLCLQNPCVKMRAYTYPKILFDYV